MSGVKLCVSWCSTLHGFHFGPRWLLEFQPLRLYSASKKEKCLLRAHFISCTYKSTYIPLREFAHRNTPSWRNESLLWAVVCPDQERIRNWCGPVQKLLRISRWQQESFKLILGLSEYCTLCDCTGHMPIKLIYLMKRRRRRNMEGQLEVYAPLFNLIISSFFFPFVVLRVYSTWIEHLANCFIS